MLMLGVFFFVMAAINFGIVRMHESKAENLALKRPHLNSPDEIAENEKTHKIRLNAAKTGKFASAMLGLSGVLMLSLYFVL